MYTKAADPKNCRTQASSRGEDVRRFVAAANGSRAKKATWFGGARPIAGHLLEIDRLGVEASPLFLHFAFLSYPSFAVGSVKTLLQASPYPAQRQFTAQGLPALSDSVIQKIAPVATKGFHIDILSILGWFCVLTDCVASDAIVSDAREGKQRGRRLPAVRIGPGNRDGRGDILLPSRAYEPRLERPSLAVGYIIGMTVDNYSIGRQTVGSSAGVAKPAPVSTSNPTVASRVSSGFS